MALVFLSHADAFENTRVHFILVTSEAVERYWEIKNGKNLSVMTLAFWLCFEPPSRGVPPFFPQHCHPEAPGKAGVNVFVGGGLKKMEK